MAIRRPKSNKNPPFLSHEFIIQNHADIVSCVAMVFIVGLMFQATNPIASVFVALQHNVTVNATDSTEQYTLYTHGPKDVFTVFFYFLIGIVIHAVIQEYVLDKVIRKLHLSKVKMSKFNESGQLIAFYGASAIYGFDIIYNENYLLNINSLWEGYPHATLPFYTKFFFIIQIAYWVHCFPELYFQKVKKEEMAARVQYAVLYLVFITAAYFLNVTRVALCLLILHYTVEFVFHLSRILYFSEKNEAASTGFMLLNGLFVLVRLGSITLAVLTFWYGLAKSGTTSISFAEGNFNTQLVRYGLAKSGTTSISFAEGNFNTQLVRISCLAGVGLLQAYMMWNFITFQQRRRRHDGGHTVSGGSATYTTTRSPSSPEAAKRGKKKGETTVTENGNTAQRSSPKTDKKKQ